MPGESIDGHGLKGKILRSKELLLLDKTYMYCISYQLRMSSKFVGDNSRAATIEISPARSERRRRRKCRVSVMVRASPVGTAEILALVSPLKGLGSLPQLTQHCAAATRLACAGLISSRPQSGRVASCALIGPRTMEYFRLLYRSVPGWRPFPTLPASQTVAARRCGR